MPMTKSKLERWLEAYGHAWETRDPDAAASLFTHDALYYETPFGEPARGRDGVREYWARATKIHKDVRFSYEVLSVSDDRGIAWWSAEYTRTTTGVQATLDGILVLSFDENGLCRELREWWHRTERQPP